MAILELLIGAVFGAVVGFVTGVFVYRNNSKDISPIADKVDVIYDKVEELAEKL
jgi:gas vesicle protein